MKILFTPALLRLFGQKTTGISHARNRHKIRKEKGSFASQRHGDYNDALQDVL